MTDNEIIEMYLPHEVAIKKVHDEALYEMNNGGLNISIGTACNRLKSDYLNNVITNKAKAYFNGVEGFEIDARYGSLILTFNDIRSRFRKATKVNYPKPTCTTTRNKEWEQGILFTDPQYVPKISIEIKYLINEEFTEYEKIFFVKRVGYQQIEICKLPLHQNIKTIKATESKLTHEQITIKKANDDNKS